MPSAATSSVIACSGAPLKTVEADFLVVPWFEGDPPSAVAELDAASGGEIGRAIALKEFAARPYDLFVTPVIDRSWRTRRIALAGAGPRSDFDSDLARELAASTGFSTRQRRSERMAFVLRADVVPRGAAAHGVPVRTGGRARKSGARSGRKRNHLRHRRDLDQAGRRHGENERRHGRRGGGGVRDARRGAPRRADSHRRCGARHRKHAGWPRHQTRRYFE